MFKITKCSRFLSLHIIRYILVIKSKEGLVAVTAIWFEFTTLFKFARILNYELGIGIDLTTSLTFLANSASDFNRLSLGVAFLCEMSIFLLVPL